MPLIESEKCFRRFFSLAFRYLISIQHLNILGYFYLCIRTIECFSFFKLFAMLTEDQVRYILPFYFSFWIWNNNKTKQIFTSGKKMTPFSPTCHVTLVQTTPPAFLEKRNSNNSFCIVRDNFSFSENFPSFYSSFFIINFNNTKSVEAWAMVTKRCAWGTCRSDSRYKHKPYMLGVFFISFPKPKKKLEQCLRWIAACCRPSYQLNVTKIKSHHFVCSKVRDNFFF